MLNPDRPISRTTYNNLRVEIDGGIVYLGFHAINRKPLQPHEVALVAGCVQLCDGSELKLLIELARKLDTPGAILKALEEKKNPPPKAPRKPRRGEARSARYNHMTGYIEVERW